MIALLLLYRSRAKQKAVINYSQHVPRHRAAKEKRKEKQQLRQVRLKLVQVSWALQSRAQGSPSHTPGRLDMAFRNAFFSLLPPVWDNDFCVWPLTVHGGLEYGLALESYKQREQQGSFAGSALAACPGTAGHTDALPAPPAQRGPALNGFQFVLCICATLGKKQENRGLSVASCCILL